MEGDVVVDTLVMVGGRELEERVEGGREREVEEGRWKWKWSGELWLILSWWRAKEEGEG